METEKGAMPFYWFDRLPKEVVSPQYSTAVGSTVRGTYVEVGLYRMQGGTGADAHSHPNEQIIVVLSGRVLARVGSDEAEIGAGGVIHVPPRRIHQVRALEDTTFLSCKHIVTGNGNAERAPLSS